MHLQPATINAAALTRCLSRGVNEVQLAREHGQSTAVPVALPASLFQSTAPLRRAALHSAPRANVSVRLEGDRGGGQAPQRGPFLKATKQSASSVAPLPLCSSSIWLRRWDASEAHSKPHLALLLKRRKDVGEEACLCLPFSQSRLPSFSLHPLLSRPLPTCRSLMASLAECRSSPRLRLAATRRTDGCRPRGPASKS